MSLSRSPELITVAKQVARKLRRNQTTAEQVFWKAVRNRRFIGKKFLRHHVIFHDLLGKETFFVPDFYCAESKLVVEIDGKIHDYRNREDGLRSDIIKDLGLKVIRFKNEEVEQHLDRVLEDLRKHL